MNRFVTEKEVEEAKKKREEEWEQARAAGREIPAEEPIDSRSLYEKLKEQKDRKQEDFEEQLKFKNMIYKGLNQEDHAFLATVAKKQAEIDGKRFNEESEELKEYRISSHNNAQMENAQKIEDKAAKKSKIAEDFLKKKNSQALIMSSIVRKRKPSKDESDEVGKKRKSLDPEKEGETDSAVPPSSLSSLADYPSSSDEEDEEGKS